MISFIKDTYNDCQSILDKDSAANSLIEVFFFYPGFHATTIHKISNRLWKSKLFFLSTFFAYISRLITGIEIHPGATIGKRVFIDHGMGTVIGETVIIGNDVILLHGVTLGAKHFLLRKGKRHPTISNGVIIGANTSILGNITIGENTIVGCKSLVLESVPANVVIVGIPAKIIKNRSNYIP